MKQQILEIYELGLEKFAGDTNAAKSFTVGFIKEAYSQHTWEADAISGAFKALTGGAVGIGLGLGMHGLSTAMNAAGTNSLRTHFQTSLARVKATNPLLEDADSSKVDSYAETIFKFAPHVAADPNLLSSVLGHCVQGEGVDTTNLKTITDLDAKLIEARKGAMFSPKNYF